MNLFWNFTFISPKKRHLLNISRRSNLPNSKVHYFSLLYRKYKLETLQQSIRVQASSGQNNTYNNKTWSVRCLCAKLASVSHEGAQSDQESTRRARYEPKISNLPEPWWNTIATVIRVCVWGNSVECAKWPLAVEIVAQPVGLGVNSDDAVEWVLINSSRKGEISNGVHITYCFISESGIDIKIAKF